MNSSKPILAEQEDIYTEFRRKKTVLQDKKLEEGLRIGVKLRAEVETRAQSSHNANVGYKKSNGVKPASLNSDTPISDKVDTRQ